MAIRCAHSIADFSENRGITPDNIIASMDETEVFAVEAADVAQQAITEGVAGVNHSWDEVYSRAKSDIEAARSVVEDLKKLGLISEPPMEMLEKALEEAIASVRTK
jgi:malate dehydrogenase (oxaloacetate-decarboxylating)